MPSHLAIDGGPRTRSAPYPHWPHYAADEIAAATAPLAAGRVNYWTGEEGRAFEAEYAAYLGRRHAIALSNGTVAIELALRALGVGPGDEVVVPSRTFIATASAAVAVGAKPVFCDVDRDSGNMTPATVQEALTPRTRAIVPVHLGGWPADVEGLVDLAAPRGIHVVEDCAQAHGATLRGRPVGAFGAASAFSFCQDKIVTTGGEGGLVATDDAALWERMWSYKDHGKGYDAVFRREHPPGFRWVHESFGTNWRLTEPQSAIGRAQLRKLPEWSRIRRQNAALLASHLTKSPHVRVPEPPAGFEHAYYRLYAYIDPRRLRAGWDRERIVSAIQAEGVPCFTGSCSEIYLEQAVVRAGLSPPARFPVARELGETSLAFLVHPTLAPDDIHDAGAAATKVLDAALG